VSPRATQVYAMLRAYLAWIPGPRAATPPAARGEVAAKRRKCPACDGGKFTRRRGILQECDRCIETRPESKRFGQPTGWIRVDPQTLKQPVAEQEEAHELSGSERTQWRNLTDSALRRIELQLAQSEGREAAPDAYTAAYEKAEALLSQGSYPDLVEALRWLRNAQPMLHSLVWQAVIYAPFGPPTGSVESACHAVCEALAARMPERIDVPGWARDAADWRDKKESLHRGRTPHHQQQRDERKTEIEQLRADGMSLRKIAPIYGISHTQVARIVTDGVATVAA
jgi:hypothetical protein